MGKRFASLLSLLAAVTFLWIGAAVAQSQGTGPNYDNWAQTAQRAEATLVAGRASDDALEELRRQVSTWRQVFTIARDAHRTRIKTLQTQLDALGPAPEQGPEPRDIFERRAELTSQLEEVQTPALRAEEAYNRADGLIREIDTTIRERATDRLLTLGPSPLNPTSWPQALTSLKDSYNVLRREVQEA